MEVGLPLLDVANAEGVVDVNGVVVEVGGPGARSNLPTPEIQWFGEGFYVTKSGRL